jgi:hypothetical protein
VWLIRLPLASQAVLPPLVTNGVDVVVEGSNYVIDEAGQLVSGVAEFVTDAGTFVADATAGTIVSRAQLGLQLPPHVGRQRLEALQPPAPGEARPRVTREEFEALGQPSPPCRSAPTQAGPQAIPRSPACRPNRYAPHQNPGKPSSAANKAFRTAFLGLPFGNLS